MKTSTRLLALLLTVILCIGIFASCKKDVEEGDNTEDSSDSTNTPATTFSRENFLVLAEGKATDYVLVFDDDINQNVRNLMTTFVANFRQKTGTRINTVTDNAAVTAKEIVVYEMDNRREVSEELEKITTPSGKGYRIVTKDEKIIVAANDEYYLEAALNLLIKAMTEYPEAGERLYAIPKDYVGVFDIPTPSGNIVKVSNVYTASGNYTMNVSNAVASDYANYLQQLEASGFEELTNNVVGNNKFSTYVKDSIYGHQAVYTMYYPSQQAYKVTYGVLDFLPASRAESVGNATVTPSITQIGREGLYGAPGMSMIVQNSDGSYIIFDGGNTNTSDKVDLLNFLKDNNPNGGKPVIAGWFVTHAHGDHINLTNDFLDSYSKEIDLRMVGYNFPDWENISMSWEESQGYDAMSLGTLAIKFQNIIKTKYPDTETWVVHTGQVMEFPGVSMTVLYTPEDLATTSSTHYGGLKPDGSVVFGSGNHTCTAYRLVLNEQTSAIILGDSESELCKWMNEVYGKSMKSDILQVTHHGFNGGDLKYYQAIDPDYCFWACNDEQFQNQTKSYDFNQFLLNIGGFTGGKVRQHYTASHTTTILCTSTGPQKK